MKAFRGLGTRKQGERLRSAVLTLWLAALTATVGVALALLVPPLGAGATPAAVPMTFTVDTETDSLDAAPSCDYGEDYAIDAALLPGPDGLTSLREAVCAANGNLGPDTIEFDISGPGPYTILLSPFPSETSATASLLVLDGGTTIDGTTQSGYAGTPLIFISKEPSVTGPVYGFVLLSSGNTVRGLALGGLTQAVRIESDEADGNLIEDNFLGTDITGAIDQGNGSGVQIVLGADGNTVQGNLISGNLTGVGINHSDSTGNIVQDNLVGTDLAGTGALANGTGVKIDSSPGNSVLDNTISGSLLDGIVIEGSAAASNLVSDNRIGTDAAGTADLGNGHNGVSIVNASVTTIAGNVISGNIWNGINLDGPSNVVQGNKIGTDVTGTVAIPNAPDGYPPGSGAYWIAACGANEPFFRGLRIQGSNNIIGGLGAGNLISANGVGGLLILGGSNNIVQGNFIGTDAAGEVALPNGGYGVHVRPGPGCTGATGNLIGGAGAGEGNIISGNGAGVYLVGPASDTTIQGNYIGTDASGLTAIPNGTIGVWINALSGAGGPSGSSIRNNVISGNANDGIELVASDILIEANVIGADASGAAPLPNAGAGIHLAQGSASGVPSTDNLVVENVIGHNGYQGVALCCADTIGNSMRRNSIFQNGELGIYEGGANGSIDPPEITSVDADSVEGTACVGCTVEVFIADPDPSGFGEGKTFLGQGVAMGGTFSIPISLICGEVTATSTDASGNTSEFSANVTSGSCLTLLNPLILAGAALVGGALGGGAAVWFRRRAMWVVIGFAVGGVLVGAVYYAAASSVRRLPTQAPQAEVNIPAPPSLVGSGPTVTPPAFPTATEAAAEPSASPTETASPTATTSPQPVCTPVACPSGVLVCPSGACPGGCGQVCAAATSTRTPLPPTAAPDTTGPSIKPISDSPDPIYVNQPQGCSPTTSLVTAAITDPSGVASAYILFFHTAIGQVPMSNSSGSTWTATLGPYSGTGDGTVDYQIHAVDSRGNATDSAFGQITVLACLP